jgi:hypothetical protein
MAPLIALTQVGTVLDWDPADRRLIATNLTLAAPMPQQDPAGLSALRRHDAEQFTGRA